MSQEHGQKTKLGRWCATCGHDHGPLYACEHYPEDVLAEIAQQASSWQGKLNSPDGIVEILEMAESAGVPPDVAQLALQLQRMWAGLGAGP